MKENAHYLLTSIFAAVVGLLGLAAGAGAQQPLEAAVSPGTVLIGSFYDGCTVSVTGEAPSDAEVLVRVTGKRQDLHLKKKGKVFGLLWMNLDTITLEDVPNVFLLYTSGPFESLVASSPESSPVWKLGLSSLEKGIKIVGEPADREQLFSEFLKLKQSEGLYAVKQERIRYSKTIGDHRTFEAALDISPRVSPGQYNLEIYAIKEGNVIAQTSRSMEVKLDGFPSMLSVLAFRHGAVFGILATLVAVVAGLVMGFVFGGGKGGH